jgi:maltooligosyltrehalose trehalohydrolase
VSRRIAVWAPAPEVVALRTPEGTLPMQRDERGWWRTDHPYAGRYELLVDGDPLPDPRSPWQPEGIRGPSHTVDHDTFAWTDHAWTGRPLSSSVVYELHVGTFTPAGTFDGVVERLPHLRSLGVDTIELMPVAEFPGERGWGYDGVLLYAPHHAYGGPDGLKRLVDAAHAAGIAVVLDVVYNHLGPSGNHLARFGPYFTHHHTTPWGDAVNFDDRGSDEVRRFVCDNARQWLRDYHIDGLRLDAIQAIHDESAVHVLEQLATEVEQLQRATGRVHWLIAESDRNDPLPVRSRDAHGYGLDAAWSDDFHHAVHAAMTGERDGYYEDFGDVDLVRRALEYTFVVGGRYSAHRDRVHGRPADVPPDRFVCFLQNHDQVGNRAHGERSAALMPHDALFATAALLLLGPFVPMLFQGEEWGATTPFLYFTDHDDPHIAAAVRRGRRAEFASFASFGGASEVPDPQDPATARRSQLDWTEVDRPGHAELLAWHRALLQLRRTMLASLVGPSDDVRAMVTDRIVAFRRGTYTVAVNTGDGTARIETGDGTALVLSRGDVGFGPATLSLGPFAVAVVRQDR